MNLFLHIFLPSEVYTQLLDEDFFTLPSAPQFLFDQYGKVHESFIWSRKNKSNNTYTSELCHKTT